MSPPATGPPTASFSPVMVYQSEPLPLAPMVAQMYTEECPTLRVQQPAEGSTRDLVPRGISDHQEKGLCCLCTRFRISDTRFCSAGQNCSLFHSCASHGIWANYVASGGDLDS